jgi:glycosyltransferase involved in cell wall biosynthesis
MPDVSVIVTGHREGIIAGATGRSALEAIAYARRVSGLTAEIIVVLDNASLDTKEVLTSAFADAGPAKVQVIETSVGDPGQARNAGIEIASGTCSTFLDADDLWSFNWLDAAWKLTQERPDSIVHSMCNVVFGRQKNVWWHIDSEGPFYDPTYLCWSNYWDAMAFARTEIFRDTPFEPNDLKLGFGHEDWHWNCLTVEKHIPHKPAPDTIHFKRRRKGSQMSLVEAASAVMRPLRFVSR